MKRSFFFFLALLVIIIFSPQLKSQDKGFGLGFILGEPTGISTKLWTSGDNAFDFALGWGWRDYGFGPRDWKYGNSFIYLHSTYLWHDFDLIRSRASFPVYYGIGGRLVSGGSNTGLAVRGVIGIAWHPRDVSLDVFLELAPVFDLIPATGFDFDGAIGIRYFF